MTRTVLVVHSSGPQGPGEGSEPLVGRLQQELGDEYDVRFPIMPGTETDPHYEPWRERLSAELAAVNGEAIVVGHSLGSSVALSYVAEQGAEGIAGLVLATTPYWGTEDWAHEWTLPEGWPTEGTTLPPTFLFHSRDDEEVPFAHLDFYAARLPEATVRPLDGNGHLYDRGDLSEIVEAIREL